MCDYCGCRTRSLLAALGEDHDRIRSLSAQVRRALDVGDDGGARASLRGLSAVLGPHSALEEGGLYPSLGAVGVAVERMYAEHEEVDTTIAQAAGGQAPLDSVLGALDRLAHHIHVEEFDLFPASHQLLDDAAWDRLEQHHHEVQHERGIPHRHDPGG